MKLLSKFTAGFAGVAALIGAANAAPVTLGTVTVDDSAFADSITAVTGSTEFFDVDGGGVTIESALDESLDGIRCEGNVGACSFDVNFDGGAINGAGDDIALFGLGGDGTMPELFWLLINGVIVQNVELVQTGVIQDGFNIKQLLVDLSDFGVAAGQSVNSVRIIVGAGMDSEDFAGFAALNEPVVTPLPAAFLMFLGGAAGLFGASRKKKAA